MTVDQMGDSIAALAPDHTSTMARTIARNMLFTLFAQVVVKFATAGFSIFAVRQLGDTAFGRYATAGALVSMLSMLAELGVTQYGIREIARDRRRTDSLVSAMTAVRLVLSAIAMVTCVAVAIAIGYDAELVWAVALGSASFLAFAVQGPLDVVLRGHERVDVASALLAATQLAYVALGAGFLNSGGGYIGLLFASVGSVVVTAILTWWTVGRSVARVRWVFRPREWLPVLKCGIPFAIGGIGIMLSDRVGTVLLSAWRPSQEVGWYAVAINLISSLMMLWNSFGTALLPTLTRESSADRTVVGLVFRRSALALSMLYLPIAVGTVVVAPELTRLLYTDVFSPTADALRIVVWTLPLRTLGYVCSSMLWVLGREGAMGRIFLFAAGFEAALDLLLVPTFGLYGCAVGAVAGAALSTGLFLLRLRGDVNANGIAAGLLRIALASLGMGAFACELSSVGVSLLVIVPSAAAAYGLLLLAVGAASIAGARRAIGLAFSSIFRTT